MADPHLPAKKSTELTKFEEAAVSLFSKGYTPPEIAKMKFPDDPQKRKNLRKRLWRMLERNPQVANALAAKAHATMALGLVPATERLSKRARRLGKPPEVRLLMEASGFHNPRVQHEHSGDVSVTLNIPRPEKVSGVVDEVLEAEVVED